MSNNRSDQIAAYEAGHRLLIAALVKCPRAMWKFKPAPSHWSIHEIIIHIADSEANGYMRGRRIIAEPGLPVFAFDQDRWASELDYHAQNPEDALELFRLLRKTMSAILRGLPEEAWQRTLEHPEAGTMTLERWLDMFTKHVETHIRQIERIFAAWQAMQQQAQ